MLWPTKICQDLQRILWNFFYLDLSVTDSKLLNPILHSSFMPEEGSNFSFLRRNEETIISHEETVEIPLLMISILIFEL
jgi:hypothetical protein